MKVERASQDYRVFFRRQVHAAPSDNGRVHPPIRCRQEAATTVRCLTFIAARSSTGNCMMRRIAVASCTARRKNMRYPAELRRPKDR